MKIELLAADSFGTRSMATYIETGDLRVMVDPGVALAPDRYGLPPHPIEARRRDEAWELIGERTKTADLIVITHYHRDHFNPEFPELFEGKEVFLKDYERNINYHQKLRACDLIEKIRPRVKRIEIAEGRRLEFGKTVIHFSPPLPHGRSEKLGYVVSLSISSGDIFLYTSDVQGIVRTEPLEFIQNERPDIIYLDGPNTPMLGYQFFEEDLKFSLESIEKLITDGSVTRFIIDHHLLRDQNWQIQLGPLVERVETAASFMGRDEELLEAGRKELFQNHPVENVDKLKKIVKR